MILRPNTAEDLPYVFSTWLRGLAGETHGPGDSWQFRPTETQVSRSDFLRGYHTAIEQILARVDTYVTVAAAEEDPAVVLGYLVWEQPNLLHYLHVKAPFRQQRIGTKLLAHHSLLPSKCVATHKRYSSDWIFQKYRGLRFNPFAIWRTSEVK